MRLTLTRRLSDPETQSIFGVLHADGGGLQPRMTCEREWARNVAGQSCVPTGFYVLEPHNGAKYEGTYALIGESVGHFAAPGIPRSACVLHWASIGRHLKGCIAVGERVLWSPAGGRLDGRACIASVLDALNRLDGPHYLTIRLESGLSMR